ncbi:MAG: GNAT family N-acetyltransferase [Treponema sp.]|nr:GNAT family N-acetyltransferase [Treponema sp.]
MLKKEAFLSKDKLEHNPFLQKIDASYDIDFYRVIDGVQPEFSAQLYDDLILNNFAEEEREEKSDFQTFFEKDADNDVRRENINIVAISKGNFVGLLTGMAFHKSKLGYFDYLVVDNSVRGKGIGGKIFQTSKKLLKTVAQKHNYDNDNLAVLLTVEKSDATMNIDKGQDPRKRLAFYARQNCQRIVGMPCYVPGIFDAKTGTQKPPINCYDWLIAGINRNFQDGEIAMNRPTALQFNADNLDLQYTDPQGRPAEETETYKKIEESLSNEICVENLIDKDSSKTVVC